MISGLVRGGNITDILLSLLHSLPGVILALSVHEFFHGFVAYKLGDRTAKNDGRLTLNPLRHLDPFGFLSMLLFGFGWAKPVMVDYRYLKNRRRDVALISLAGPLSNFLLAFLLCIVRGFYIMLPMEGTLALSVYRILLYAIVLNVSLGLFNLIPCPPLDGSKILYSFLPARTVWKIAPYERYFPLVLIALLYTGILDAPLDFLSDGILDFYFYVSNLFTELFV